MVTRTKAPQRCLRQCSQVVSQFDLGLGKHRRIAPTKIRLEVMSPARDRVFQFQCHSARLLLSCTFRIYSFQQRSSSSQLRSSIRELSSDGRGNLVTSSRFSALPSLRIKPVSFPQSRPLDCWVLSACASASKVGCMSSGLRCSSSSLLLRGCRCIPYRTSWSRPVHMLET